MKLKTSQLIYGFVTLLALVACLQVARSIHQNLKTAETAQKTVKSTLAQVKDNQARQTHYDKVDTADLRDTQKFQQIGQQFIQDMFKQLSKKQIDNPKSDVANDQVVSAFLGATFGGDVDEGRPEISYIKDDIAYSKGVDGSGVGFGTITYQQSGKKQTITVLMQLTDKGINEIQVGQVRDTTGTGGQS